MMRGQLISLDGIDGAGKTTHLQTIKNWFAERNLPVVFTREPGGTPVGEHIRSLLLDKSSKISIETEALLMFAARQQHIQDVIEPALAKGVFVVSDRFTDASYAYQGAGRGLSMSKIGQLEEWVQGDLRPSLTILLDVPLAVSMQRIEKNREKDRFEEEEHAFFARVREAYLQLANGQPKRYHVINSHQDLEEVRRHIEQVLDDWLHHYQKGAL